MKDNERIEGIREIDHSFTEKWFSHEFSLSTGLYQLTYDGQWRCVFASGSCLRILNCAASDFLERLQKLDAYTACKAPRKTVGAILREIAAGQEPGAFISICRNGALQYIKGTLAVARGPEGPLCVYGQITDVSEEQREDMRLREQLRQQSEELNITMGQMGKYISFYDVSAGTLTTLPSAAKVLGVPLVIENFPESFLANPTKGYPPATGEILRSFIDAIRRGDSTGSCDYPTVTADGRSIWLHREFATIFDDSGRPVRAVISSEDITQSHIQEEENRQLREQARLNDQIFNIVAQHSNRILYEYDLGTRTTRPWNMESGKEDILAHLYANEYSADNLKSNQSVLPDSLDDVKQFFADIHGGTPVGEMNVHIRLADGRTRWYHFKYSSIFDAGQPTTALISIEDVTERHEHEMAYRRHVQSIEQDAEGHLMYIESDLTADRVELLAGQMLPEEERNVQCSHSDFGRLMLDLKFQYEEAAEASQYFSCENLLGLYAKGERQLKSEWQVRFHDGTRHWLDTEIVLTADPYDGHIKAFFRMIDITEEQEERLSMAQRADYDAMTGLLRKVEGEERIKKQLAEGDKRGGILIFLDLDDLKGINDSLGHKAGDAAIMGIADTLKSHFRSGDILIRAGGDEFIVFLLGAGQSVSSVELSMRSLLQKLSGIPIGEHGERTIHCSAGCAVEIPGTDTYETLFKRADTALYHVKRSGKNNYAFYVPEMSREDYEFKVKQAAPAVKGAASEDELRHLLEVIAAKYVGVALFNLSKNYSRTLSVGGSAAAPPSGTVEGFWQGCNIHPDDLTGTLDALSRDGLLSRYAQGHRRIRHYFRNLDGADYVRTEVEVDFYGTGAGDICAFLFFRRDTASGRELELLRLQKILELSTDADFEYICLIDVQTKSYSIFSGDGRNTHGIPEVADFDLATKHIRDTQIPPEERDAYYEHAALEHVLRRMGEGRYSYRYRMEDGITREAVFTWYEESHFELLMTVRRIT